MNTEWGRIKEQRVYEPVPGALTIPMDSIVGKPMEWTPEQRAADEPVF